MKLLSKKVAAFGAYLSGLMLYAALVAVYLTLVLRFLGGWLDHVFDTDKTLYAIVAAALIISQGLLLGMLTSGLLRVIRRNLR